MSTLEINDPQSDAAVKLPEAKRKRKESVPKLEEKKKESVPKKKKETVRRKKA